MSSIFNTSYSDSIRRVDSPSNTKVSNTPEEVKGEKFSDILSNHQTQKLGDVNARGSLGYQPLEQQKISRGETTAQENELTNLSFTETQTLTSTPEENPSFALKKSGLDTYKLSSRELSLESQLDEAVTTRINPDRKSAIIDLPGPIQGKAPSAPKVFSAKMTPLESPKPILPAKIEPKDIASTEDLLEKLIGEAGRHHGIDPSLSVAVARAESSLKVDAVSKDGHHSKGIFQLLDNTGKEMMARLDVDGHYQPFDPKLNAHLGVGYLRRLHDLFSKESILTSNLKTIPVKSGEDLEKISIAAFNAGEGRVARAQALAKAQGKNPSSYDEIQAFLPVSTRTYVKRVSNLKSAVEARDDETSIA